MSWERECVRLAADLATKRHDFMGWRGDSLAMYARFTRGAAALGFAQRLGDRPTEGEILARFRSEVDADRSPPEVTEALEHCEKQFQQWNVERAERDDPFRLTPVDRFRVGVAGQLPEALRVPRWQRHASLALDAWIGQQAMGKLMDARHRIAFRQLLTEPLPYGRPDHEPYLPFDDEDELPAHLRGGDA